MINVQNLVYHFFKSNTWFQMDNCYVLVSIKWYIYSVSIEYNIFSYIYFMIIFKANTVWYMILYSIHRYYVHDPRVTLCKSNLSLGKFRHAIGVVHWQQKEKKIVFFILCAHQQNWQPTVLWGVVFCLLCSQFLIILLCSCGHPHSHFHFHFFQLLRAIKY